MQDQRMAFQRARQPRQAEQLGWDIQEAADKLGVAYMTIWRAIRDGEFPAVKLRNRIIVPVKAVEMMFDTAVKSGELIDAAEWTAAWAANSASPEVA